MLGATFLGHQGWLLHTAATRVLVDPLLTDGFGHGGLAGRVFPPRRIDMDALRSLDAVILTHEHDDHFDIATLVELDRGVDVYISARSSTAMAEFLTGQGFSVHRVEAGADLRIGELRYRTFAAEHQVWADEWDVMPFIVSDATGPGTFVSAVDVGLPSRLVDALGQERRTIGILCLANNVTDTRYTVRGCSLRGGSDDTEALRGSFEARWRAVAELVGPPEATAVCGGGWSHRADAAVLDAVTFPIDSEALCGALARSTGGRFESVLPGRTFLHDADGLHLREADWVALAPRATWPDRTRRDIDAPGLLGPACGRRNQPASPEVIADALRPFARFMFARPVFGQLHGLQVASTDEATIAFVLHVDAREPIVLAYRSEAGAFVPVDVVAPLQTFASGYELWAADLLALLRGELGPSALCYTGRARVFNRWPHRVRVSVHDLWVFAHPLHRPEVAATLYEHARRACGQA